MCLGVRPAQFRQEHRKTIDGRLCAAAFVQARQTYTGCTDAPNPMGESGREWCYVEAQLLASSSDVSAWDYCAPRPDYDALRVASKDIFASKISEIRGHVSQLQKAQHAAEEVLDMYDKHCARD